MAPGKGDLQPLKRGFSAALGVILGSIFFACSAPQSGGGSFNELKIQESIDAVNLALSHQDCASALTVIQPIFESSSSRDDVRLATAHANACYTGFSLFSFLQNLTTFSGNLGGGGLWSFLVKQFPSRAVPGDAVVESSKNAMDALLAMTLPGLPRQTFGWVNLTTENPGSLILSQRQDAANSLLPFMAMANMGSLLSRNGVPDSSFHQTQELTWLDPTKTKGDGCSFASSLLLFVDSIGYLQSVSSTAAASAYSQMSHYLSVGLDAACAYGCATLCEDATLCTSCPFLLRDRTQCSGTATDAYSCAAAGIARFVDLDWQGP